MDSCVLMFGLIPLRAEKELKGEVLTISDGWETPLHDDYHFVLRLTGAPELPTQTMNLTRSANFLSRPFRKSGLNADDVSFQIGQNVR